MQKIISAIIIPLPGFMKPVSITCQTGRHIRFEIAGKPFFETYEASCKGCKAGIDFNDEGIIMGVECEKFTLGSGKTF